MAGTADSRASGQRLTLNRAVMACNGGPLGCGPENSPKPLAGVFRLRDLGDTKLDPSIMRCFADTTVSSFVARLVRALMHPAGAGAPARRAGHAYPPGLPGDRCDDGTR